MRKVVISCVAFLATFFVFLYAETISHTFKFEEGDFIFSKLHGDSIAIASKSFPSLMTPQGFPVIPFLNKNIGLEPGYSLRAVRPYFNKRLIRENVDLIAAGVPQPTDVDMTRLAYCGTAYEKKVYPDSNYVVGKGFNIGDVPIASLYLSPFVFDANRRELYFVDSIRVDVDLAEGIVPRAASTLTETQYDLLGSLILNRDSLNAEPALKLPLFWGDVQYLIVTNNDLKSSFEPLAKWKNKKGVPSKIVTTEQIEKRYDGNDLPAKIKNCLIDLWKNNALQYVLLGGDVEVVPSYVCDFQDQDNPKRIHHIPSDVYYSNTSDVEWDTNGDGVKGDRFKDDFDFYPNLHVTRAPVGTPSEAKVFVDRTIEYEQSPRIYRALLQSGATISGQERGYILAKKLFNEVVNQKVRLESYEFFDEYTYSGVPFTPQSFSDELSRGYQFTEVFSHGYYQGFCGRDPKPGYIDGVYFFDVARAASLQNPNHTLFTTTACNTNQFDTTETVLNRNPCLSEAFIRNPKSGIIGYFGSSRSGWQGSVPNSLECSAGYEAEFYRRLLYSHLKPYNKNFGALVTFTKMALCALANDDKYYRYLHYSLNPIGDPETPIINDNVCEFSNASAEYDESGILKVTTGFDDARVCVSSVQDDGYYSVDYGDERSFDTGTGVFDVWITRQNYVPKHFKATRSYTAIKDSIENDSLIITPTPIIQSMSPNPATSNVTVKFKRIKEQSVLMLSLVPTDGGQAYIYDISEDAKETTLSVGGMKRGIYVVQLREDGVWSSSKKLILQ